MPDNQLVVIALRPNIFVVGSLAMDLIVSTHRMPARGETVMGSEFHRVPGGKGANQAVAASRLGAAVTMVGRVGDDPFGHDQLSGLRSEGIDTGYLTVDRSAPTGIALITLSGGDNQIIVVPGANMECSKDDVDRAEEALQRADVVILQMEIPLEVNRHVVSKAKALGKTIVFNPAPALALDDEILSGVTVLTPNETEAEVLTGIPVESVDDAQLAAANLIGRGVEHVVVTLGGDGALIATKDATAHVGAFSVNVVDPTAAGDTFNGALAVKLGQRSSDSIDLSTLHDAVTFANAAGALAVTKVGAQPSIPTFQEVEQFLASHLR